MRAHGRLDCIGKDGCNSVSFECKEAPSKCSVTCKDGEPACNSLTVRRARSFGSDDDGIILNDETRSRLPLVLRSACRPAPPCCGAAWVRGLCTTAHGFTLNLLRLLIRFPTHR